MTSRRSFIKRLGQASLVYSGGAQLISQLDDLDITKVTILHTNDVHSRIDPFPMDGSRNQGLGGASRRAALIDQIRAKEPNLLLFDAGDIFQGTPYFNFYGGELEMKLMAKMKYDAGTIGNHDFDGGIDSLHKQMAHGNFPFIISNYDFDNTVLSGKTYPMKTFVKNKIKIGVTGVGIELKGLVPKTLTKETRYLDPIESANKQAAILKHDLGCDYVVCLSHLGFRYSESKVSDITLAKQSKDIDLIIGGHTHTFMREPYKVEGTNGNIVVINQAGWAGIMLGRIDLYFEKNKKGTCLTCRNEYIR